MTNKRISDYPEPGPLDVGAYHFGGSDRAEAIKDYMATHNVDYDTAKKVFLKAMINYDLPFKSFL